LENGVAEILLGLSSFFTLISLIQYINRNPKYFTIFDTLTKAIPNVAKYLLGVMPIYFGFVFFGKPVVFYFSYHCLLEVREV
jgi:hypothetical protein